MSDRRYYSREAEMREARERLIMSVVLTGFGIGIGAIVALLLAPRSGEETRRQLGEALDQAKNKVEDAASEVGRNIREGVEKLGDKVGDEVNDRVQQVRRSSY